MLKRIIWRVFKYGVIGLVLAAVMVGVFLYGFAARTDESSFATRLIFRIERKIDKVLGRPQQDERAVAQIESTFIRFKGTLYRLPGTDYVAGGAMTLWGEDLLVMPRNGDVFIFADGKGLEQTAIRPPDSGFADYLAISTTPKYADYMHLPDMIRFNDILFTDRPEFRGLILSYTFFDKGRECYGTRLARAAIGQDIARAADATIGPGDWTVFFETAPCLALNPGWFAIHGQFAGGRMAMTPDGRLIFGSGDYVLDGFETYDVGIQKRDNSYGKILSIDPMTGAAEIVSIGHRNLQGVAVTPEGQIWTIEQAIRGGDELNHVRAGENGGWPLESMGTLYTGQRLPVPGVEGRHDVYDKPAFAWLPSAATSALTYIDDFHPAWDGGLLAGSLSSAEFGQSLFHIRTNGEHVLFVERIRLKRRVRYVLQYGKRLAVWLDPTDLLILEPVPRLDPLKEGLERMRRETPADVAARVETVLAGCNRCHSFEQSQDDKGPSLNGILGRKIGGTDYDGYSDAIRTMPGRWDREKLAAYLSDPETFAPGTTMPPAGLEEGPVLEALIKTLDYINTVDDTHITYN